MPRPKRPDFNAPADLLSRLPAKTIVTRGDKLRLLDDLENRAGGLIATGTNRATFRAIEQDVRAAGRAQRDSAPVVAEAPSKAEKRTEQGSSIPARALECKIGEDLILKIEGHSGLNLYAAENDELLYCLTPDLADQLAQALTDMADDLRQDANARTWSRSLLATTTE